MMSEQAEDRKHACPKCGSKAVRRSLRSGLVESIFCPLLGLRPYRCLACDERFHDRRGASGRKETIQE